MGRLVVVLGLVAASGCDGGQGGEVGCRLVDVVGTIPFAEHSEGAETSGAETFAALAPSYESAFTWSFGEGETELTVEIEPGGDGSPDVTVLGPCWLTLQIPAWLTLETADGRLAVRLPASVAARKDMPPHIAAIVPTRELLTASGEVRFPDPAPSTAIVLVIIQNGEAFVSIELADELTEGYPHMLGVNPVVAAHW
jgi:hypothetical protein